MPHLIKPCAECQRATRSPHAKFADFPGTIVRRGELCDSCWRSRGPRLTPSQSRTRAYHLAGLASFLRRRHERQTTIARAAYYQERMSNA